MNCRMILCAALLSVFGSLGNAHADPAIAFYVELDGKVIELETGVVSPLDDGLGEIIYAAFEADELMEPVNVDTIVKNLRLIGWRRDGDRLFIYQSRHEIVELPESAMKHRMVERISDRQPTSACPLSHCKTSRSTSAS